MNQEHIYRARYRQSHAVVVGINRYVDDAPLKFAVNDARAVHDVLIGRYGFAPENVRLLLDEQATSANILRAMAAVGRASEVDDRVVFFYAGHGHTLPGRSGDVGFLVPHDSRTDDDSTLLPWKTLVATTDFIRAKHVLFIMDACYSGLATTRKPQAGATRFVGDLLRRRATQVITAGKEDEPVDDAGGPRPNHSIFTGHLLDGLEGAAETGKGILTAWGLMSYVYKEVALAAGSRQTPHYGSMDGQGDFVFAAPDLGVGNEAAELEEHTFIVLPYVDETVLPQDELTAKVSRAKALLSTDAGAIELHDLLMVEVRAFLAATPEDAFPLTGSVDTDDVAARIGRYEAAVHRLSVVAACVAYWGGNTHSHPLLKIFSRASDRIGNAHGNGAWLALRWLPVLTTFYASGIAAIEAGRLEMLAKLFALSLPSDSERRFGNTLVGVMADAVLTLNQTEVMRALPALKNRRVPVSDYMFDLLQPRLDDALFLGKDYEPAFDMFEMLFCLAAFDASLVVGSFEWGPPGRFSGRGQYLGTDGKFARLIETARREQRDWPPLRAGLMGGDPSRLLAALNAAS